jgi:hypothetical protein
MPLSHHGSGAPACDDRGVRGPVLRVRLLGGVELRFGEDRVPPLDTARAESLLAYADALERLARDLEKRSSHHRRIAAALQHGPAGHLNAISG